MYIHYSKAVTILQNVWCNLVKILTFISNLRSWVKLLIKPEIEIEFYYINSHLVMCCNIFFRNKMRKAKHEYIQYLHIRKVAEDRYTVREYLLNNWIIKNIISVSNIVCLFNLFTMEQYSHKPYLYLSKFSLLPCT